VKFATSLKLRESDRAPGISKRKQHF